MAAIDPEQQSGAAPLGAEATDALRHAGRSASRAADRSREELEGALEAAQEGLQEAERYIRSKAAQNPIGTVAVAAVLAIWAAGFALYALAAPALGPGAAAALVAAAAALVALLAGAALTAMLREQRRQATEYPTPNVDTVVAEHARRAVILAEPEPPEPELPLLSALPIGMIGGLVRDRPLAALAIGAVAAYVLMRKPALARDIASFVGVTLRR